MIQLAIKSSPDFNKEGSFIFHKNIIYIGSDQSSDLYINDQLIHTNHIFLEILDSRLLCQLGKTSEFILVNKKRTTGHKYLNIGDEIKLGESLIRIESFLFEEKPLFKDELNRLTEEIVKSDKALLGILKEVQKSLS